MHSLVLYSTLIVDLVVSLYVCSPLAVLGLGPVGSAARRWSRRGLPPTGTLSRVGVSTAWETHWGMRGFGWGFGGLVRCVSVCVEGSDALGGSESYLALG
ncbi:hypothetical protein K456DRAFT_851270 [Colletotrichum gloeosporioides 23]|nr:hypothetical protein K456DRAFT_851270 [Colletotrichum gloeosporioides 23]